MREYVNTLLLFWQISEKDMGLLRERLKRASKNRVVPVATIQPTMKVVIPPVQHVSDTENDNIDGTSDYEENNAVLNNSQESNHERNRQRNDKNSPTNSENSFSCTSEILPSSVEYSPTSEIEFRW